MTKAPIKGSLSVTEGELWLQKLRGDIRSIKPGPIFEQLGQMTKYIALTLSAITAHDRFPAWQHVAPLAADKNGNVSQTLRWDRAPPWETGCKHG